MSKQHSRSEYADRNEKSSHDESPSLPLLTKIQEVHIRNLQSIISMLCRLINDFTKVIDYYDIQFTSQQLTPKAIVSIKEANNEIKYHQKINPIQREQSTNNITAQIEQTLQLLAKIKIKEVENNLTKVKRYEQSPIPSSFQAQLSIITEKQSQQNLHNYLKKGFTNKRRSKSNINKNSYVFNTSSIQDFQFQVIRQQTRKSLDNPYHKNNQTRKNLYNDLQKIKGQDSLFPAVKSYLDKHRKNNSSKPAQYVITKLI